MISHANWWNTMRGECVRPEGHVHSLNNELRTLNSISISKMSRWFVLEVNYGFNEKPQCVGNLRICSFRRVLRRHVITSALNIPYIGYLLELIKSDEICIDWIALIAIDWKDRSLVCVSRVHTENVIIENNPIISGISIRGSSAFAQNGLPHSVWHGKNNINNNFAPNPTWQNSHFLHLRYFSHSFILLQLIRSGYAMGAHIYSNIIAAIRSQ